MLRGTGIVSCQEQTVVQTMPNRTARNELLVAKGASLLVVRGVCEMWRHDMFEIKSGECHDLQ